MKGLKMERFFEWKGATPLGKMGDGNSCVQRVCVMCASVSICVKDIRNKALRESLVWHLTGQTQP